MTEQELTQHIKSVVLPMLQGSEIKDAIKETVAAAVSPLATTQTAFFSEMLAGIKREAPPPAKSREKGEAFGRIVRATAWAYKQHSGNDGVLAALKQWGDEDLAEVQGAYQKSLLASDSPSGGFLVAPQFSTDIIELRRAKTVVRGLQPRVVPMPSGTMDIPKITGGATGYYGNEATNITKSQQTFGQIQLTWRKLTALVPISNNLIRYASIGADALVRDDIVRALAVTEDAAFLRGDGMAGQPKGLRYWCPAANLVAGQAASLAAVSQDLGYAILKLRNNNVPMSRPAFIFSPRSEHYLLTVQNTDGVFAFKDEMLQRGTVFGIKYVSTTSIGNAYTVGANADCSEVILADFDDVVIGDSNRLTIDVSPDAAYYDGSSVVAAFSRDETVIRAIAEHDFALRDSNAVAVITGVRWSA